MKRALALLLLPLAMASCEPTAPPALDAGASPNASILPAPLATEPPDIPDAGAASPAADGQPLIQGIPADSAGRLIIPSAAAPPPEPLRPESQLPAESPSLREVGGVSLEAAFRWRDVPLPPKAP